MNNSIELLISLSLDDGDSAELQELSYQLISGIEQLHIDSIKSVSTGLKSDGTKGANWNTLGEIAVTLAPAILPPLFAFLKSWVERKSSLPVKINIKFGKNKTAKIEYDPTKISEEELEKIIKTLSRSTRK